MKYLIVCILFLVGSVCCYIFACGPQYPDEVRFSIFNPDAFRQKGFENFQYTNHLFAYPGIDGVSEMNSVGYVLPDENVTLWKKYCRNKPSDEDIEEAVYQLSVTDMESGTLNNSMIRYLKKSNDKQALDYLAFAKGCEEVNRFLSDPWERDKEDFQKPLRQQLITEALQKAAKSKDEIKLRYAFLAIRLAFYNNDVKTIDNVYKQYFKGRPQKNIIDYWALYFYGPFQPEGATANFNAAQVFANAPDKRMNTVYQYKKTIPVNATLQLAKSNQEKIAVWLIDAVRNPGRALTNIQKIYALDQHSPYLDFLLLREINKLEDWIYTPEYYLFQPSVPSDNKYSSIKYTTLLKNVESDRKYAKSVLSFVNIVDSVDNKKKLLWRNTKAYIHLMLKEYDQTLAICGSLQQTATEKSYQQIKMMEALALVGRQEKGKAIISEKIKPVILQQQAQKNYPFIFAIAKELEMKGNTTDAALLITNVNKGDFWDAQNVYWKNSKGVDNDYVDYYWEYFGYVDAQYTATELKALMTDIQNNVNKKDPFNSWKYASIKNENQSRLYDLLGTKYIRENNLEAALQAFKKVNDTIWTSEFYPYKFYLAANPFYTDMYNEHRPTYADTVHFTKTTITSTLIDYLKKGADIKRTDRDYYYFLAANCYLNMTEYGNSWLMRRYYWSSSEREEGFSDDPEYYSCMLAKKYYLEAKKVSRSKKFSALCLRMAGRCEAYRLRHAYDDRYNINENKTFQQNRDYKDLKKQYPDYYDALISNCESFESYFAARNKK
ncbi:MAG: hypothetical protein QM802_14180 [Agriterribacter sp.]